MTISVQSAFESFLVEDVILTLGNLRGCLDWLGTGPERDRSALERLDRQLGYLEDRARSMCRLLQHADPAESDNLFAAEFDPDPEPRGDTGGSGALAGERDGANQSAPLFRSRRA